MRRSMALLGPLLALVAIFPACGGDDEGPPRVTTTTLAPAAAAAGREVCGAVFADATKLPSLDRAREAGPQLGRIVEDLAALKADDTAGQLTREAAVDRLTVLLEAFEIVCDDVYGVSAPPDYLDLSAP